MSTRYDIERGFFLSVIADIERSEQAVEEVSEFFDNATRDDLARLEHEENQHEGEMRDMPPYDPAEDTPENFRRRVAAMPPEELLLLRRMRATLICRNLAVAGHSHSRMPGVEIDSWLVLLKVLDAEIERRHLADSLWG